MNKQIGVIVLGAGINPTSFKQSFIDQYENVDTSKQKARKIEFAEKSDEDSRWIEVYAE